MPITTQTQTQQLYSHAAEPKAVQQRRAKYREDEQQAGMLPSNIMFDRRVVRGNTYAARIMPADNTLHLKQTKQPSSPSATSTAKRSSIKALRSITTPDAVEGRKHMDVQTDSYLEELTDTVAEADNTTQTDAFLDRPASPLFVPQKSGVDAATQIEQGELFDFNAEVEPLLEVLVGKTLEQALMEVLEEEELAAMKAHQEHFEAVRAAELVATQRMEAAERRKVEEKDRRLAQERQRKERERAVRQKVAASAFARGYLDGIVTRVFDQLADAGYFYDPVEREVEDAFLPWLVDQAVGHLERGLLARRVVAALVADALALQEQRDIAAVVAAEQAEAAAAAAATKAAEEQAAADAAQLAAIRGKAAFILTQLEPRLVTPEAAEAVRKELTAKAGEEAAAKWAAAKAAAGDEKRAALEAAAAAAAAEAEAARAAAEEAGQEAPAAPEPMPADQVEAEVAAAAAAVPKVEPSEVTDADVVSALMEQGVLSKDAIVTGLAAAALKEAEAEKQQPQPQQQQ